MLEEGEEDELEEIVVEEDELEELVVEVDEPEELVVEVEEEPPRSRDDEAEEE